MDPGLHGQPPQARSVQLDSVEVPLRQGVLIGGEIHPAVLFVHGDEAIIAAGYARVGRDDHEFAPGDLADQSPVDAVEIEMLVAVPFGQPEEAPAVLEEMEGIVQIDPGRLSFLEYQAALSGRPVGEVELQVILLAVERLDGQRAAVRAPGEAWVAGSKFT
jgi:hypothetical protein